MKTQAPSNARQQRAEALKRWSLAQKWAKRLSNPNLPLWMRVTSGNFQQSVAPELTHPIDWWLNAFTWAAVIQQQQSNN